MSRIQPAEGTAVRARAVAVLPFLWQPHAGEYGVTAGGYLREWHPDRGWQAVRPLPHLQPEREAEPG